MPGPWPALLTFPLRLWMRKGMAGELRSSQNSFSNIFFLRRSMARLCPLLAFCRRGVDRSFRRYPQPPTSHP